MLTVGNLLKILTLLSFYRGGWKVNLPDKFFIRFIFYVFYRNFKHTSYIFVIFQQIFFFNKIVCSSLPFKWFITGNLFSVMNHLRKKFFSKIFVSKLHYNFLKKFFSKIFQKSLFIFFFFFWKNFFNFSFLFFLFFSFFEKSLFFFFYFFLFFYFCFFIFFFFYFFLFLFFKKEILKKNFFLEFFLFFSLYPLFPKRRTPPFRGGLAKILFIS